VNLQVDNSSMSITLGTVERFTSAARHNLAEAIMDKDENLGLRAVASVSYVSTTAVGWTAYGAKTATDATVATAKGVGYFLKKMF